MQKATHTSTDFAHELEARGLVFQHTSDSLKAITDTPRTLYLGIDPTADALHVGSLLALITLRRFMAHGHKVIVLVGGATGTIGDPSGKTQERLLLSEEVVQKNTENIVRQIETVLGTRDFAVVNNVEWLGNASLLSFLREVGKHFTVNDMIRKESVRRRIETPEASISFTEFSYTLLQAYDFYQLHTTYDCTLQIGGSDQWGNITAGVELIRKKTSHEVHGLTLPLLVDEKTGRKFGKTESGTVWIDARKTTPFQFYQFWFNTPDVRVVQYLQYYTLLPLKKIVTLIEAMRAHPEKRDAQRTLAYEVTALVHGKDVAQKVQNVSQAIFYRSFTTLSTDERTLLLEAVPHIKIEDEIPLTTLLIEGTLASSKREARTLITGGAITINGKKITGADTIINTSMLQNGLALLKKGKKDIRILYA